MGHTINDAEDDQHLLNELKGVEHDGNTVEEKKSSSLRAGFNMTKSFIGAASFELPWAFMQAGLWGAIFGLIFLAFVTNYTAKLLVKSRKMTSTPAQSTYISIGKEAMGPLGVFLVYFGVITMNLGVCSSYVDFIKSNLSLAIDGILEHTSYSDTQIPPWACILCVLPVLLLLSMIRTYHFLLYTSVPGCMALLLAMLASYIYFFIEFELKPLTYYPIIHLESYPLFFGNAAFLFCIHSVVLPIESSMANKEQFNTMTNISMTFVTLLNMSFAAIVYMLLGYCTQGLVTANFYPGDWVPIIVELLLCLDLLFTYTIFMIPCAEMIEGLCRISPITSSSKTTFFIKSSLLRAGLVLFTVVFAVLVPKFNYITNLVGGFSNNLVAIVLPPLFYILLLRKQKERVTWWQYVVNIVVVVVGILAGLATTVTTLLSIFQVDIAVGIDLKTPAGWYESPADCVPTNYYSYTPGIFFG